MRVIFSLLKLSNKLYQYNLEYNYLKNKLHNIFCETLEFSAKFS